MKIYLADFQALLCISVIVNDSAATATSSSEFMNGR